MSAKHTPGPWKVGLIESAGLHGVFSENTSEPVAYGAVRDPRFRGENRWPEVDANMALIAAAPDLLAAAESALAGLRGTTLDDAECAALEPLRAAIAKARGGT